MQSVRQAILDLAKRWEGPWTDAEMHAAVERRLGRRVEKSSLARTRGQIPEIECVGSERQGTRPVAIHQLRS